MSLMSVLALMLFVAIVLLAVLLGLLTALMTYREGSDTIEPRPVLRKVRSLLRKHPWRSALIARLLQVYVSGKGPESYPGYLLGSAGAAPPKPVS